MVKWKFFFAVILYVILGVIAYFNFGFHHVLTERFGQKNTLDQPVWDTLEEKTENSETDTGKSP